MKTIALMLLSAAAMAAQLPNQDSTQLPPVDNAAGSAETNSHTDGPGLIHGLPAELFLKATICAQTLDLRMAEPHMVVATYMNPEQ